MQIINFNSFFGVGNIIKTYDWQQNYTVDDQYMVKVLTYNEKDILFVLISDLLYYSTSYLLVVEDYGMSSLNYFIVITFIIILLVYILLFYDLSIVLSY